jgi:Leucine-rich repeat (LRR) protein
MKNFYRGSIPCIIILLFFFSHSVFSDLQQDKDAVAEILRLNHMNWGWGITDTSNNRIVFLKLRAFGDIETLSVIPPVIGVLDSLKSLHLEGEFNSLPKEIGNLKALKHVELGFDWYYGLPDEFFNCTNIEYLHLVGSNLSFLPVKDNIVKLKKLRILKLNNNNFLELPAFLGELDSLRELDFSWNSLKNADISSKLFNCRKLHKLNLTRCYAKSLPPEIGNCMEMDTLILYQCMFITLPVEIAKLQSIKYLDLSMNYLSPATMTPEVKAWADKFDPDWEQHQRGSVEINNNLTISESGRRNRYFYGNKLEIQCNSEANFSLKISDIKGRIVHQNSLIHLQAGVNNIFLPNQLSAGVYFVSVAKGREVFTERLLVSR